MRIVYQSGELYVSFTHAEVDHIVENRGKPAKMDISWLKTLHEDISKCVMAHWSAVEVWDEEYFQDNGTFQFLNKNDMVWVSAVDHFGRAYGIINDEQTKLTITSDTDGKYNVLLIGTRKDKFIQDNYQGVEVLK